MDQNWYQQGIEKAGAGDLQGAIAAFNQALQQNPDWADAYYQRGRVCFNLGNLQQAITDYTRALFNDRQNFAVYYARSLAYLTDGQTEAAVDDIKQAILLKPNDAAAYHLLASARQKQSATEKAIASYKKAAELYLDRQDVANCRRCMEAIRQLQPTAFTATTPAQQPTMPPANFDDFVQQALDKAKQRNYGAALDDLEWAIQLDPGDAKAYASRAKIYADLGDWYNAIANYRQAAQIFLDWADKPNAQQMLDQIQQLEAVRKQAIKPVTATSRNVASLPSSRSPSTGTLSRQVRYKLLQLVGDDRRIVAGLVDRLKQKYPNMPEDWYWEKAIYDLERDRR
ncbi:MAG: hypothetical protein Kow00121_35150 [Elainellaceae cyanobacterium]